MLCESRYIWNINLPIGWNGSYANVGTCHLLLKVYCDTLLGLPWLEQGHYELSLVWDYSNFSSVLSTNSFLQGMSLIFTASPEFSFELLHCHLQKLSNFFTILLFLGAWIYRQVKLLWNRITWAIKCYASQGDCPHVFHAALTFSKKHSLLSLYLTTCPLCHHVCSARSVDEVPLLLAQGVIAVRFHQPWL